MTLAPTTMYGGCNTRLQGAERANIHGTWLNLAAGDGRYNNLLVARCQSIIAFDLDEKALHRLVERLPATHRGKIRSVVGDMTAPFPFPAGEFDGCLCTGVLHLFKEPVLRRIARRNIQGSSSPFQLHHEFCCGH